MAGGIAKATFAHAHLVANQGPWYNHAGMRALNGWILCLLLVGTVNGFGMTIMNAFQGLPYWEDSFGDPHGKTLGLVTAMSTIGQVCAFPFAPYAMDYLGRKKTIWISMFFFILSAILQSSAQNLEMFTAGRFFFGFSIPFSSACTILISEIAFPTQRAQATALVGPFTALGGVLQSWILLGALGIKGTWGWRVLCVVHALLSLTLGILLIWCPESPRWLCYKHRDTEAAEMLARYHSFGNSSHPLILVQMEEMLKTCHDRRTADKFYKGWLAFFRTKGNLRRLRVILFLAFSRPFSGASLIGPYLLKLLDHVGIVDRKVQLTINGGLHTWSLLVGLVAALVIERAGRRKMFITAAAGMFAIWACMTATLGLYTEHDNDEAGTAFIALIFIYQAFHSIAFAPVIVAYVGEILPFHLRAKGQALFGLLHILFKACVNYGNPLLLKILEWKLFFVYLGCLIFILLFICLFLVETRGLTLEETARLYDTELLSLSEQPDVAELMHIEEDDEDDEYEAKKTAYLVHFPTLHGSQASLYRVDSVSSNTSRKSIKKKPPPIFIPEP